jgi:hypothetical protein
MEVAERWGEWADIRSLSQGWIGACLVQRGGARVRGGTKKLWCGIVELLCNNENVLYVVRHGDEYSTFASLYHFNKEMR